MSDSPISSGLRRYRPSPVEAVGIGAMILLVAASTLEGGTPLQKWLFLVPPPVLFAVAYLNEEAMLASLEVVVQIGAILAFFPSLSPSVRFTFLGGSALLAVGYLIRIDYLAEDRYWPVGGTGLVILATGISISGTQPVVFNSLLVLGSILLGVYSLLGFFALGVRIQAIWVVLNVAFGVAPGLRLLGLLGVL
jgi:hypothetical protein